MEPICAEVFPGNSIDAVSYRSFILDNDIKSGIIIADKGFPPVRIIQELGERPVSKTPVQSMIFPHFPIKPELKAAGMFP